MRGMLTRITRNAFKVLGDLVEEVTFVTKANKNFDLATGLPILDSTETFTMSGVVIEEKRKDNPTLETKIILRMEQFNKTSIVSLDALDTVEVRGEVYKVTHPIENNGYTFTVTLTKALA